MISQQVEKIVHRSNRGLRSTSEARCASDVSSTLHSILELALGGQRVISDDTRSKELGKLEEMVEESRLAKEGFFYRPPITEREREWRSKNRTADAAHCCWIGKAN